MELYIIACISFAIMYHIRYTIDVLHIVKEVAMMHEAEGNFNPLIYSVVQFILSIFLMPAYLIMMFTLSKNKILHEASVGILTKHYDLEAKEK